MPTISDMTNRLAFIESLNDLLSIENNVLERLNNRIVETPIHESQMLLQHHLKEEYKQHNRLKNLIAYYGGKPTNSKADLVPLNDSITDEMIKNNYKNTLNNIHLESTATKTDDNSTKMTSKEMETLLATEDIIIKNTEILEYKRILKISESIKAKDAINILKHNLKEKESMFNKIKKIPSTLLGHTGNKNNEREAFQLGSAIGDVLTSYWNSKENPSKVYLFNRRVHHGGIGALLGLSSLYKDQPVITGILSGLGARLAKDDSKDSKEWFSFKKKEDDVEK
jgi:ferritin-like metal-binding protein YciE